MNRQLVLVGAVSAAVAALTTFLLMKTSQTAPETKNGIGPMVQEQLRQPAMTGNTPRVASQTQGAPRLDDGHSSLMRGGDERARMQAETVVLDRQFHSQPRDAAWASQTEQTLHETMAADVMVATEIVPSKLTYSCRTDLCLVKAEFSKYGDAEDWGIMLVTAAGATFASAKPMVVALPNGQTELQLYAARR